MVVTVQNTECQPVPESVIQPEGETVLEFMIDMPTSDSASK